MQAFSAGQVEKGFVNRKRFHKWRKFEHHRTHLMPDSGIFRHVWTHHHRVGAKLKRLEHGHCRANAIDAGNIAAGGDDAALAAPHDHRSVAQGRVIALFNRREERVTIDMRDLELVHLRVVKDAWRTAGGAAAQASRT